MNSQIKKRLLRTLVLSVIALGIGAGVAWVQVQSEGVRVVTKESKPAPMAGVRLGGAFELVNHLGYTVTEADFAGGHKLMYFGFTYCPAICPTELQKISRVVSMLEKDYPEAAAGVQPLFVTIDPERDRVPVMKEYVGLFHKRMVGLTGTSAQVDLMKKNYRVFAAKVQEEGMNDYTMDHSSFIYLMGPDDELVSMYRVADTADEIYADVVKRLEL